MTLTFKDLLEKIESSVVFKDFLSTTPEAKLVAGFFTINIKEDSVEGSLDYSDKKLIYIFNKNGEMKEEEILDKSQPLEPINTDIKVDLSDLKKMVKEELAKNEMANKLDKIIAILQTHENTTIWNITAMCEGFVIFLIHIDAQTGEVKKFEKKSIFDFVKPMKE